MKGVTRGATRIVTVTENRELRKSVYCVMTDLASRHGVTASAIGAPFEVAQPARMSFENLRVYKAAELLIVLVEHLMESTPRISRSDADQVRRASSSVAYNIAEAFGSEHPRQKIYHLGVARGSADETRAILMKLAKTGAVPAAQTMRSSTIARTIAKMVTAWIEAIKSKQAGNA